MAERLAPQCESDWQGPSDDECVDDLLVIRCEGLPGHDSGGFNTPHLGRHPDDHGLVVWRKGTDCLENYWGGVRQHQFNPCPTHGGAQSDGTEVDE